MNRKGVFRAFSPGLAITYIILFLVALCMFYPYYYVVIYSFSTYSEIVGVTLPLIPHGFTIEGILSVMQAKFISSAYSNTIFVVCVGSVLSLSIQLLLAYPLSRKVPGSRVILFLIYFTMLFSGGMIPLYYAVRMTKLLNTLWSLFIPVLVNPFYVFLIRTFFASLPNSLIESAYIDGASELRIFSSIILPLSLPIMATITLMTAVGLWNSWFTASIYIRDTALKPLQLIVRELLLLSGQEMGADIANISLGSMPPAMLRMSMVTVSTLPIICLYPFLQRYLIKGMTMGAIKE